jgi:hypothetical protein
MNSFTHPRLDYTFTNYLAPLMANFDTIGNYSDILHKDDGMLTQWFNLEQWLYEMNVYAINKNNITIKHRFVFVNIFSVVVNRLCDV